MEQKGIFYVPDYIANAGGIVYDTDRLMYGQHNKERATKNVMQIYQTMERRVSGDYCLNCCNHQNRSPA